MAKGKKFQVVRIRGGGVKRVVEPRFARFEEDGRVHVYPTDACEGDSRVVEGALSCTVQIAPVEDELL